MITRPLVRQTGFLLFPFSFGMTQTLIIQEQLLNGGSIKVWKPYKNLLKSMA